MAAMPKPPRTVREQIARCYANLARTHAALGRGDHAYRQIDHMIRAKLERRLLDGTMQMRSLYDDERIKLTAAQACYYCGDAENLCADRLIPKMRGGPDASDNLIWACRSCNSSKGPRDLLQWMAVKRAVSAAPAAAALRQDRGAVLRGARVARSSAGRPRRRAPDAIRRAVAADVVPTARPADAVGASRRTG